MQSLGSGRVITIFRIGKLLVMDLTRCPPRLLNSRLCRFYWKVSAS